MSTLWLLIQNNEKRKGPNLNLATSLCTLTIGIYALCFQGLFPLPTCLARGRPPFYSYFERTSREQCGCVKGIYLDRLVASLYKPIVLFFETFSSVYYLFLLLYPIGLEPIPIIIYTQTKTDKNLPYLIHSLNQRYTHYSINN